MREGHSLRELQDAGWVGGLVRLCRHFLAWPLILCLVFSVLFTPVHTHTCAHTYILKSCLAYATPLCGSLWFSRCCSWRWHLTPIAAAFSWDSITACLAKADWFFKDNIFGGGILFFFPPQKPFLLRKEKHDLQLDLARCWMPPGRSPAPSVLFYFSPL